MKPETLLVIISAVVAIAEALNVMLFWRIRVAQLESEKRVLEEVDDKYVRKDSALVAHPQIGLAG